MYEHLPDSHKAISVNYNLDLGIGAFDRKLHPIVNIADLQESDIPLVVEKMIVDSYSVMFTNVMADAPDIAANPDAALSQVQQQNAVVGNSSNAVSIQATIGESTLPRND